MFLKKILFVVKKETKSIDVSKIETYNKVIELRKSKQEVILLSYEIDLQLIKQARLEKGYTLEEMSKKLGIKGKSNYFKRENGDTEFKSTELPMLSDLLDIDYEKIFVKSLRKSKQREATA